MKFWRRNKLALFWGVFVVVLLYWHSVAMALDTGPDEYWVHGGLMIGF